MNAVTVRKGYTSFVQRDIKEIGDVFVVEMHNCTTYHQIVHTRIKFRTDSGFERPELNIFILSSTQMMKMYLSGVELVPGAIKAQISECRDLEKIYACNKIQKMQ